MHIQPLIDRGRVWGRGVGGRVKGEGGENGLTTGYGIQLYKFVIRFGSGGCVFMGDVSQMHKDLGLGVFR